MAAKKKPVPFEEGLAELEQLVAQMEGEMPLDAAMAAYERGMKLHAELLSQLDAGEARLKILSEGEAKA